MIANCVIFSIAIPVAAVKQHVEVHGTIFGGSFPFGQENKFEKVCDGPG